MDSKKRKTLLEDYIHKLCYALACEAVFQKSKDDYRSDILGMISNIAHQDAEDARIAYVKELQRLGRWR